MKLRTTDAVALKNAMAGRLVVAGQDYASIGPWMPPALLLFSAAAAAAATAYATDISVCTRDKDISTPPFVDTPFPILDPVPAACPWLPGFSPDWTLDIDGIHGPEQVTLVAITDPCTWEAATVNYGYIALGLDFGVRWLIQDFLMTVSAERTTGATPAGAYTITFDPGAVFTSLIVS